MRLALVLAAVFALTTPAAAADPPKVDFELHSQPIGVLGLPLPESAKPVYKVGLTAKVDDKGEGAGTLALDPTGPPASDEFGFPGAVAAVPVVTFDCRLEYVKNTVKVYSSLRLGAPESERVVFQDEWRLYAVTGPKITSKLFLVASTSRGREGRLLVHGGDGQVKYLVDLRPPPGPERFPPCHPGCFPAGTPIAVPGGSKAVDALRVGDVVTTVGPAGAAGKGMVAAVFVTRNRLVEVRTEAGLLVTADTQPLALAGGRCGRPAS